MGHGFKVIKYCLYNIIGPYLRLTSNLPILSMAATMDSSKSNFNILSLSGLLSVSPDFSKANSARFYLVLLPLNSGEVTLAYHHTNTILLPDSEENSLILLNSGYSSKYFSGFMPSASNNLILNYFT